MSQISAKSIAKYAIMPGVWPRLKALFTSGFGSIAFLMANIYNMVKLLPSNHPYLNANNIGKYGIRHVIAEAANRLIFKKENWDQILIFTALMSGFVLLLAQIALLLIAFLFEPVFAQGFSIPLPSADFLNSVVSSTPPTISPAEFSGSIFSTPNPIAVPGQTSVSTDIAFLLLDRVFGVPNFFCTAGNVCTDILENGRWPFHVALHSMLKFYSGGLLIVAVLIFLYFIVVIIGETATTGTPFGERFQNVWVPIRLVVALLLLTPITYGLNGGQYIGLFAAKMGSGLATNAWHRFNNVIASRDPSGRASPTGNSSNLLALPAEPDLSPAVQFMSLVHACAYQEWALDKDKTHRKNVPPDLKDLNKIAQVPPNQDSKVRAYFAKTPSPWAQPGNPLADQTFLEIRTGNSGTTYTEALDFYGNNNIIIRFGKKLKPENNKENYSGNIEPTCGEISINISDLSYRNTDNPVGEDGEINQKGGAPYIQSYYFDLIKQMWFGAETSEGGQANLLRQYSQRFAEFHALNSKTAEIPFACKIGCNNKELPSCTNKTPAGDLECAAISPHRKELTDAITLWYNSTTKAAVKVAWQKYNEKGMAHQMTDEIYNRGWAGAGIWYSKISQINGGFVNAISETPAPIALPIIMQKISKHRKTTDKIIQGPEQYNPISSEDKPIKQILNIHKAEIKGKALYELYKSWIENRSDAKDEDKKLTGNMIKDGMNFIFGTKGMLSMRKENAHIHPLAQLSALGKGIINSSIRNLGLSTGLSILGGAVAALQIPIVGPLASLGAGFLSTTAFIGMTAGVVLFYILPLQPFIFFFFAVAGWVKGLFEAMVGIPLWALAHMRIDGEGLPGEAAQNGYFLIFELFLRPILIVFGLIAATIIFVTQVRTLHFIWDLVIDNVGGYHQADTVLSGATDNAVLDGVQQSAIAKAETANAAAIKAGKTPPHDISKILRPDPLFNSFEINRNIIDEFFFTILYTVIVYMMATASFKLIDKIPDSIMRWAGQGVSAFGDADKNPAEGLQQKAATGGMIQGQKLLQSVKQVGSDTGGLLGRALAPDPPPPPPKPKVK